MQMEPFLLRTCITKNQTNDKHAQKTNEATIHLIAENDDENSNEEAEVEQAGKAKQGQSKEWNFFTANENTGSSRCNLCQKDFVQGKNSMNRGTSTLMNH